MIIWLIGMSGSGKTEIGKRLYRAIKKDHINSVFIDGDVIRKMNNNDLGHTIEDRKKNSDRISSLCKFLDDQDIHVVCSILSIFPEAWKWNRINFRNYYQIYIRVPWDIIKQRDKKNIYHRAEKWEIANVVGVDIEFPEPLNSDIVIDNDIDLDSRELESLALNLYHSIFPVS